MNEHQQRSLRRKKILFTCLGGSFAVHLIVLVFVYKNPPGAFQNIAATFTRNLNTPEDSAIDMDKDTLLEEVFEDFDNLSMQSVLPFDHEKSVVQIKTQPLFEAIQEVGIPSPSDLLSIDDVALAIESIEVGQADAGHLVEIPTNINVPLLAAHSELTLRPHPFAVDLQDFDSETLNGYQLSPEIPENASSEGQHLGLSSGQDFSAFLPKEAGEVPSFEELPLRPQPLMVFKSFQEPIANWESVGPSQTAPKDIAAYHLPETICAADWAQHFQMETEVMKDPKGDGYLFTITLYPRTDLSAHKMKQNFTFLIDRSNSIDKHYYEAFKKAVFRTLSFLPEGDTFNIIVFDRKISRLSDRNLPISKSSIQYAKQFLSKQESGHFFSATEIYPMIEKALPATCPDDEMNTTFILTDGNTLSSPKKQQKAMQRIIEKNSGKFCIHTAAAGVSNNIVLLDLLSTCNRGALFYSRTYASFPRKFVSAVTRLKNPLIKDVAIKCYAPDPNAKIELYPSSYAAPALYQAEPYTIIGRAPSLAPFTLLIEGRNGNQWVTIEKEIALSKAKRGQAGLDKKWGLQEARIDYERFLRHDKPTKKTLKDAETRLRSCSDFAFQ